MNNNNGLPTGWVSASIGLLAETRTGGTPSRGRADFFGGSIPWVKSGELRDGRVFETEESLTALGLESSSAKVFPKGTLCIALYGATVGKIGILEIEAATNQAICGIFLPAGIETRYVFWALRFKRSDLIELGKGGAQPNISNGIIREILIPLPPGNEQRRIVQKIEELFTKLDAGVAALERVKANLKRYRAAVLKAAVEGKLTAEWRAEHPDIEPASKLLECILHERRRKWEEAQLAKYAAAGKEPPKDWKEKYREPGGPETKGPALPKRWCWVSLGQVATFQNGRAFPSKEYADEGVKLLRPGNLFADGSVRWTSGNTRRMPEVWAERHADYLVGGGELVMNLTAQSLKDEFLGRTCITSCEDKCLLNQRLARITPIGRFSPRFALVLLKSRVFRQFVNGLNTGSLIEHMFTSQLEGFGFPLPPTVEQERIVTEVERRLSIVDELQAEVEADLKRAGRLRQSILKRAFAGRLVPQDPNDEPAAKLLERIRREREAQAALKSDRMNSERSPRTRNPARRSKQEQAHRRR